jgi:hypothetical protein
VNSFLSRRALAATGAIAGAIASVAFIPPGEPAHAASAVYYVDCVNGVDTNPGTSSTTAWRTIAKANKAALQPGDSLLLARGCTWTGTQLQAKWTGTATAPITIGAYGTGAAPVIKNAGFANVKVTGSFQFIQDLYITFDPIRKDPCGQPLGQYYGVTFTDGAHDNTLRRTTSTQATAGVHLGKNSSANRVLSNQLIGNNVLQTFSSTAPGDDLGAWGMIVNGNGNEVAFNTFKNNAAVCTRPNTWIMSNSIEIYEGSNNLIHHNKAYGDRVFSELGGGAVKPANNQFFYNLYTSARPDSRFIVTRGARSPYGPVTNTVLNHNSTYLSGVGSQGVVCELGCSPSIITITDSVIWAEQKVIYADAALTFADSVVWSSTGRPVLQIGGTPAISNVIQANPLFANAVAGNLTLLTGSPAIDVDVHPATVAKDLNNVPVPQGGRSDAGAYEFVGG